MNNQIIGLIGGFYVIGFIIMLHYFLDIYESIVIGILKLKDITRLDFILAIIFLPSFLFVLLICLGVHIVDISSYKLRKWLSKPLFKNKEDL